MLDIHTLLKNLKRPKLLVQAARFGTDTFRRETDLVRLLQTTSLPGPTEAIMRLLDLESELNDERKMHLASYSLARHVEALTAIMSEQRLLVRDDPND